MIRGRVHITLTLRGGGGVGHLLTNVNWGEGGLGIVNVSKNNTVQIIEDNDEKEPNLPSGSFSLPVSNLNFAQCPQTLAI